MSSAPLQSAADPELRDDRPRFMRAKRLAHELDISESLVWLWVSEGKLPQPKRPSPRVSIFDWEEVVKALA